MLSAPATTSITPSAMPAGAEAVFCSGKKGNAGRAWISKCLSSCDTVSPVKIPNLALIMRGYSLLGAYAAKHWTSGRRSIASATVLFSHERDL
jgi:hypothetical protein